MARYRVLNDCYGFQGRYWEKDQIAEIDPKENPPKHFQLVGDSDVVPGEKGPKTKDPAASSEAKTAADVERETLLIEAKGRGIKDAELLNQDELLEVLAKDISRQKIAAIVQKAKKRQQK